MHKEAKEELRVRFIVTVLEYAKIFGVTKSCREFDVSRSTFYEWKNRYDSKGKSGLYRKKVIALTHPKKASYQTVQKVIELRTEYKLGSLRIKYYLERYHDITVSESTVTRILKANNLNRLPKYSSRRAIHSKRYSKKIPGHHVQVDVKVLNLKDLEGKTVRRYQYTAIDDAARIRALKIFPQHNQDCAIRFIDYVVEIFPFRISTIRTDRGHEFQVRFHCHIEDMGMIHVYIKPRTTHLKGKVERSHRTDQQEFYQLLSYTDDVDLIKKLKVWEYFYNFDRHHISHGGKTPYEVMKSLLVSK